MSNTETLDIALKSTSIEPEPNTIARDETNTTVHTQTPSITPEASLPSYRPNTTISVHKKPYMGFSDSSDGSESDSEGEILDMSTNRQGLVIGDFVNIGHQNWLALRQEWKKRPADWVPTRRVNLDSQTICDKITTTGILSDRPDEGVPLPEVVRVIVQVWEREGVN